MPHVFPFCDSAESQNRIRVWSSRAGSHIFLMTLPAPSQNRACRFPTHGSSDSPLNVVMSEYCCVFCLLPSLCMATVSRYPSGLSARPFAPQALPCFNATMNESDCLSVICSALPFSGLMPHTILEQTGSPKFLCYPCDIMPWTSTPRG